MMKILILVSQKRLVSSPLTEMLVFVQRACVSDGTQQVSTHRSPQIDMLFP